MNHFNELSPAEAERLAILAEECGEVVQACMKVLRHGFDSHTNRADLLKEVGDVTAAIKLMTAAGDIDSHAVKIAALSKLERIRPWLHHQEGQP